MTPLRNPEVSWDKPAQTASVRREEIESRIGKVDEKFRVLSGGLANTNIKIGEDKVLRIYREDASRLPVEEALLGKGWKSFEVPAILDVGKDFLLLSYVAHQALEDDPKQGSAVGEALAEIHSTKFEASGFLTAELSVKPAFPDLTEALVDFAKSCLDSAEGVSKKLPETLLAFFAKHRGEMRKAAGNPVLVHSDFKVSNVHWARSGRPLVLDWETAYSGTALSDLGQLFRWGTSKEFTESFESSYQNAGGNLPSDWRRWAEVFDLINLASLLKGTTARSQRALDVSARIQETLERQESQPERVKRRN